MAKLNLSQAAKATGKNRTTIWRHINSGKLSACRDRDGMPFVDTSELLRVYGELRQNATPENKKTQHNATPDYSDLIKVIEQLKKEQIEMRSQLSNLMNRISYTSANVDEVNHALLQNKIRPEDDAEWPKEIKTMADITLRNEIINRHR